MILLWPGQVNVKDAVRIITGGRETGKYAAYSILIMSSVTPVQLKHSSCSYFNQSEAVVVSYPILSFDKVSGKM